MPSNRFSLWNPHNPDKEIQMNRLDVEIKYGDKQVAYFAMSDTTVARILLDVIKRDSLFAMTYEIKITDCNDRVIE